MSSVINNTLRTALMMLLILPMLVFAQAEDRAINEPVESPAPPAFLENVQSEEDFNNLTAEQKKQVEEYFKSNSRLLFSGSPSTTSGVADKSTVQSAGVVDCFDYYNFGSVQVDLSAIMGQTVPGAPMHFAGKIKNANPYPIVDGGVYVKIFKLTDQADEVVKKDGYPLVDQFALPEQFNLSANSETDAGFDWQVPANAEDGEYFATFYFQSAKRYNLLGLSFTDDVTGNQAHFSVTNSGQTNMVRFDKSTVTLNDNPHSFAAFPQHFTKDESVTAKVTIVNPKDEAVAVSLDWKLHDWDSLRPDSVMDSKTEIVELKAGEQRTFEYVAEPTGTAVSYLVVEMKDGYSSSILNIRFVRDGVLETRINFPSIMDFPLVAGQETSVFSCVHSTNLPLVSDNVLDLVLSDKAGNVIHSYQYKGDITGAMMGVADTFVPNEDYDYLSLKASLSRNGQLIEEVTQTYDCEKIDKSLCNKPEEETGGFSDVAKKAVLLFLVVVILVALGLIVRKVFHKQPETFVGLFLMVLVGFSFGAGQVEAKTVTWSSGSIPELSYFANWGNGRTGTNQNGWIDAQTDAAASISICFNTVFCGWSDSLVAGAIAQVTYKSEVVYNGTNTVVPDNASLPIGTVVNVREIAKLDTDIVWFGTGTSADSPYGRWVANAGPRTDIGCLPSDNTGTVSITGYPISSYHLLNLNPPTPYLSAASNLSCVGSVCTVTGTGPVSVTMTFPATYGKFYSRYFGDDSNWTCAGNNVPLRVTNYIPSKAYIDPFSGARACVYIDPLANPVVGCNPGPDYTLQVPAQSISFAFTGYNPNNPPNTPTITGPATGYSGQSLSFTANGTDPDGDTVRYLFDWNNDSVGDEWAPAWPGLVNSGTSQALTHSWPSDGTFNIKVMTMDSNGTYSAWSAPIGVTISTAGVCGVANGAALAAAPTTGLCLSGTASAVGGVSHGPYSWTCNGSNGGPSQTCATVAVAPTVTFTPNPSSVFLREQSDLVWTVDGASSCTGSTGGPSWDGPKTFSGTDHKLITPLTTTVYRLTCYGLGNSSLSTTKTATVTINPPSVSLSASPTLIGSGDSSTLTWTVRGADRCVASGGWNGDKDFLNGTYTETVTPNVTTTYNLTCTAPGVSNPVSATVTLPSGNITASNCDIQPGDTYCNTTLKWNTANLLGSPSILLETNQIFSTPSNPGVQYQVTFGSQTFYLRDKQTTPNRSLVLDSATVSIGCTGGSAWTIPSVGCLLLPVMSVNLNQDIVRNGEVGTGKISILANYPLACTVIGAEVGNSSSFSHAGSVATADYTFVTQPLTSAQIVQVKCTHPSYPAVTDTADGRINVTASVEER